jgi:glutathione peroxidase
MHSIELRVKLGVRSPGDLVLQVQEQTYDYLLSSPAEEIRVSAYLDRDWEVASTFAEVFVVENSEYVSHVQGIATGSKSKRAITLPGKMFNGEQITISVKRSKRQDFMRKNIHGFSVKKINGQETRLENFSGKVLLIVNVASECGLTPQYDGLEKLYEEFKEKGLEILGFPANEFGAQEPGTNSEIQAFCRGKFGVKFPMFEKIVVKGSEQHPLYSYLTQEQPDAISPAGTKFEQDLKGYGFSRESKADVLWNFEKFLVNRKGEVIARFNPDVTPNDPVIVTAIKAALEA